MHALFYVNIDKLMLCIKASFPNEHAAFVIFITFLKCNLCIDPNVVILQVIVNKVFIVP